MTRLVIAGIKGRMGQRIQALAQNDRDLEVVYGLESIQAPALSGGVRMGNDTAELKNADVVIDFSVPAATVALLPQVVAHKKAIVIGTTGFTPLDEQKILAAAKVIPVVKSANMSLGVNVFFKTARDIARALPDYAVHIQETHHIHKKDAPSGTALQVGALIEQVSKQKVTYESFREQEVVGDHKIIFTGPADKIELVHHAESRDIFAAGALQAAKWLVGKKRGLYTMADVLGLA